MHLLFQNLTHSFYFDPILGRFRSPFIKIFFSKPTKLTIFDFQCLISFHSFDWPNFNPNKRISRKDESSFAVIQILCRNIYLGPFLTVSLDFFKITSLDLCDF